MTADPSSRDDKLDTAMADYLAALEGGGRPDRAAFLAARPALAADLAPLLDEVEALYRASRQVTTDAVAGAAAPGLHPPARVGEFEVTRVIGRGGMGVVYEATDTKLNRRVALKVLPADAAIDPAARRRFLREAQAAAGLHHPHVVPVLTVGEADGVQYYAMPLIDGHSLDAVVRVLRDRAGLAADSGADEPASKAGLLATGLAGGFVGGAAPPGDTGRVLGNPRYLDEVVRLAHDAAAALGYAHANEVVHRDVKPGNLLLDVRGKVWLTDFGLAKVRPAAGAEATTAGPAGTLRYMSPEQAAGRAAEVDARTDVYALGLTLYELLTLRPAFAAGSHTELLRQVEAAGPPAVRRHNPAVSADLETVVQKATARDRCDRYESAAAFADDLARVRAGRPVTARRLTRPQLARRWARRHRRLLFGAGGAVTAGIVAGLAASTALLLAAYRVADAERTRATAREERMLALVEELVDTDRPLREVPGAQPVQRALARRNQEVLGLAADEPGASFRVRREAAQAALRLAVIESAAGDRPAATRAARDARNRGKVLVDTAAATRQDRLDYARSELLLGGTLLAADDQQGIDHLRRAADVYTGLDAQRPDDPAVLNHLGQLRARLAIADSLRGDHPAALALARGGLAVNQRLAARFPTGHPLSYSRLAESHLNVADVCCRAGRPADAEPHFEAAVAADADYAREMRATGSPRLFSFTAAGFFGAFLAGRGRHAEARERLDDCLRVATEQAALFPNDAVYVNMVRKCQVERGRVSLLENREDEARDWFVRAVGPPGRALPVEAIGPAGTVPLPGVVDPAALVAAAEAAFAGLPPDDQLRHRLALAYLRAGRPEAAEAILRRLVGVVPHELEQAALFRFYLALCQVRRGDAAGANATFAAADGCGWQAVVTSGAVPTARKEALDAIRASAR